MTTTTTTLTTRDELKRAFTQLRRLGYAARVNFSCCSSCGSYELMSDKYVFWHRQGEDAFYPTNRFGSRLAESRGFLFDTLHIHWAGTRDEIAAVLQRNITTATVAVPDDDTVTFQIKPL